MEPKRRTMPRETVTPHEVKIKMETSQRVAIAKGAFRSHAGIAYFAKVGPDSQ